MDTSLCDKRFYDMVEESVLFPFFKCSEIVCTLDDDTRLEYNEDIFNNIRNMGINVTLRQTLHIDTIKQFCGIDENVVSILCMSYPWENKSPFKISYDCPYTTTVNSN